MIKNYVTKTLLYLLKKKAPGQNIDNIQKICLSLNQSFYHITFVDTHAIE